MNSLRLGKLFHSSVLIGLFVAAGVPPSFCADSSKPSAVRAKQSSSGNAERVQAGKSSASVYFGRAVANEKFGRSKAAIEDATKAIELEPKNWQAYELRAKAYFKVGPYTSSIADYRAAIALAPNEVRLREGLTRVFEKTGENDLLIDEVTRANKAGVKSAFLYIKRADAYYREEMYEQAAADLSVLLTMPVAKDPWKRWEFFKLRGRCYLRSKQYAKAEKDCTDALAIAPDDSKTYFCRADVRERMGKYKEAVEDLTMSIKYDPGNGRAFSIRAKIYEHLGEKKKADADRKEAIRLGQNQWGF